MSSRRTLTLRSEPATEIVEWRRSRLLAAGFGPQLADRLAGDSGFDLHAVLELTDRGCPPELAARILAPLRPTHPC